MNILKRSLSLCKAAASVKPCEATFDVPLRENLEALRLVGTLYILIVEGS